MATATAAHGTVIERNDGSSWQTMGEVTSFTFSTSADAIDVTNMGSTNKAREFIAGLVDHGEVSIDMAFLPDETDGQVALEVDMKAGTIRNYRLTYTDSTPSVDTFNAVITNYTRSGEVADKLSASVTLKVTGEITRT